MNATRSHRWFAIAALLVAGAGQGTFMLRVGLSGLGLWPERATLDMPWPWIVNVGWIVQCGMQHSGMAHHGFKRWLARWFPAGLERSLYVGVSGLVVLALTLLWATIPGEPLWHGPVWLEGIALLGVCVMGWCCLRYDYGSLLGLSQALNQAVNDNLQIGGLYRFVRHPLMLGLLLFLWGHPVMTATQALSAGGMTVYILFALPLEERELVRKFGPAYEAYQRQVPALIPWRIPCRF